MVNLGSTTKYLVPLQRRAYYIGFLVGQIMKLSKGKANPQVVNRLIIKEINKDS
jgi:Asp-tRNA(Asn)/Glu-tRNA(Gln) amidotransferase B subunit